MLFFKPKGQMVSNFKFIKGKENGLDFNSVFKVGKQLISKVLKE